MASKSAAGRGQPSKPAAKPAPKPAAKPAQPARPAPVAETLDQYAERIALRFAIAAAAVGLIVVIILNWNRNPVPLQGDRRGFGSLALYITPLTVAIFGAWGYILGLRAYNARVEPRFQRKWELAGIVVGLGYGVVAGFLIALGLELAERAFRGLELAMGQGAFITAAIVGTVTQMFVKQAMRMTGAKMLQLVILVLAMGIYLAATRIDNPEWWRIAFSHLGSLASNAHTIFNVTLTFAALLMLAWLPYVLRDVRVLIQHGMADPFAHTYFNGGILWLAIGIALVGLFKTQADPISHWVHNLAAYSLALLFGLWFVGLKKAMPRIPPEVMTLSVVVAVVLVLTLIFAAIGYFNTVGLQVISFVIGITWLQEIVRFVSSEATRLEPASEPD